MAKLYRMKLSGIRSFGCEEDDEQEITFHSPVTLFLGQNGCGKTTIIEAVKFAMIGEVPLGSKSGQGFIYDPQMAKRIETRGSVKLKMFDSKGKDLTVSKIAHVKQVKDKLQYKLVDSSLTRNKKTISTRCADVHRDVCLSLGIPKAIINSVLLCHQEDSYWPLEEPKKLKERFDEIFDSAKSNKCIETILKLKKKYAAELKVMAIKVDHAKLTKNQMEKKRSQLHEKQERLQAIKDHKKDIAEKIIPIEKELSSISVLEKEISNLSTEAELYRNKIENIKEQIQETLLNCKELDCSDQELKQKISSYESDLQSVNNQIDALEKQLEQKGREENNYTANINKDQNCLGKLQAKETENNKNIESRNKLIKQIVSTNKLNIEITKETEEIIKDLNCFVQNSQEAIKNFETTAETRETEYQNKIDAYRTNYAQLKQNITSTTKQLSEQRNEVTDLSSRLSELDAYDNELQYLEERLNRKKKEIKNLESQVNIEDLKSQIEIKQKEFNKLEDEVQKIEDEIQVLQNYNSIQTELDIQRESLGKRQTEVQALKAKHQNNFEKIFQNNVPENNLKLALDSFVSNQTKIITATTKKINQMQIEVSKLEANLNMQKDKLETTEKDLSSDSQLINEYFKEKSFEDVECIMNEDIKTLQKNKASWEYSSYMYISFIKEFKKNNPCCPICSQNVSEEKKIKQIIKDLENKIEDMPRKAGAAKVELDRKTKELNKIFTLKPTYEKVQQVKDNDIPKFKKEIFNLEKLLSEKSATLQELQNEIEYPQSNLQLANNLISDATLIDQYNKDIKKIEAEIASLKPKMPKTHINRSMQEATYELDNLKSQRKSTRLNIDSLANSLSKHVEQLQILKDERNDLQAKELSIKKDLQGKDQLALKQKEIESKIVLLENELIEAQNKMAPLEKKMKQVIEEKEKSKMADKKEKDSMWANFNKIKQNVYDIKKLQNNVTDFLKENVSEQIRYLNESIKKWRNKLEELSENKKTISKEIETLKNKQNNNKIYYRELQDNIQIRSKRKEIKKFKEDLAECEKKLGDHDVTTMQRSKRKLESILCDLYNERSKLGGQEKEQENIVREVQQELEQPIFANALTNFKKMWINYKLSEKAIADLGDCAKAIDWSMLQYHKQRMVTINEMVRDLWRTIYRGNDIDYIEIKTEMDSARGDRRTYNYRLVQVKNDVELEMRGRCSAGQRVLASIIIRIALADTFSSQCGILALDEPTTNLDKENITSLCAALCDIIMRKRSQKNFQLIIITHDQEFLEKLGRTVDLGSYYHVNRNPQGKSTIRLCKDL